MSTHWLHHLATMWILLLMWLVAAVRADKNNITGLHWENLLLETTSGKLLVQPSEGVVPNGELCGLLGPSGAGKSTFLAALGGTLDANVLQSQGDVWVQSSSTSKEHLHVRSGQVAWLAQEDAFFEMLTVRESLELAAFLELPKASKRVRDRRVQATLDSLGLTKLQHRRIGQIGHGLSGGERRRLSIGLELIAMPKLFLGDEPTSRLDSVMSEKVMKLIKKLVHQRHIPAMVSLHQPSSTIWHLLDRIVLVAPQGRVCYVGPTADALPYFASLGHACPPETNPAEFLLDLVSIDSEDVHVSLQDEARIVSLAAAFANSTQHGNDGMETLTDTVDSSSSLGTPRRRTHRRLFLPIRSSLYVAQRFGRLMVRAWRQNIRNVRVNLIRLGLATGNALLFGQIFPSVKQGCSPKSIADRTALLTFGVVNMFAMTLMKTIDLFAREKPVVRREHERQNYSSLEYLLSKVLSDIPLDFLFSAIFTTVLKTTTGLRISWTDLTTTFGVLTVAGASLGFAVGAWSPSPEAALSMGVPLMIVFMAVGIINPGGVAGQAPPPPMIAAMQQASPIAHAIRAVCLAEYTDMEFDKSRMPWRDLPRMGAFALVRNGNQVLGELGLQEVTYSAVLRQMGVVALVNFCISWMGLQSQQRKHTNKSGNGISSPVPL